MNATKIGQLGLNRPRTVQVDGSGATMRTDDLFAFVRERHQIYLRRKAGQTKPWTTDPILQQYRFCNVYRELDTVTKWIRDNWRRPHCDDPDLWFAMVVARLVNWPDTMAEAPAGSRDRVGMILS